VIINDGYVKGLEGETTVMLGVDNVTWLRLKPYFLNPNTKQHNYITFLVPLYSSLNHHTHNENHTTDSKNKMHATNMYEFWYLASLYNHQPIPQILPNAV
jgi:hypothetical protein